jgi:hypothetical protein
MIHGPDLEQPSGNMLPLAAWRAAQGNARHRIKHAATRVCPRQGRRRPRPRSLAAGEVIDFAFVAAYGLNNGSIFTLQGRRRPTPMFSATGAGRLKHASAVARPARRYGQRIELVETTELFFYFNNCPRQGRRRPTPAFCTAGARGVTTVETCVGAAAKLRPTTRTRRIYIAAGSNLPLLT